MIRLAGMRLCNGARQTAFSSAVAGLSAVSDGHWFDLAETAMTLKKPAMVLIDVDGTLVDSVPDLAFCVDEMMRQLGRPARGESAVRNWVGNGVERLVRRALINQLEGEPDEQLFQRALPIFEALYAENTSQRSCLYPGVQEALDFLKTTGVHIGCVTNKAAGLGGKLSHEEVQQVANQVSQSFVALLSRIVAALND